MTLLSEHDIAVMVRAHRSLVAKNMKRGSKASDTALSSARAPYLLSVRVQATRTFSAPGLSAPQARALSFLV